jgi:ribosomal protein S18 acetylase RimI-like enzyme
LPEPGVRSARESDSDPVALLLYESAAAMYDRFTGGRSRAVRLLGRAFESAGNNASREVITVAEVDGRVAGALAAFPVQETVSRAGGFLRLALRTIPPWRWPGAMWLYWSGARAVPNPPDASFYVDALAVEESLRRRGAARALLDAAEDRARELELPAIALDTALDNKPARSLYLNAGYDEVAYRPAGRGLPGFVALVKRLS